MWEDDCPDISDGLRQGDLLLGVPLEAQQVGEPIQGATRPIELTDVIVVSQCCTTQQKSLVSLAPLHTIKLAAQRPDVLRLLQLEEPEAFGGPFETNRLYLQPHPSMNLGLGRAKVAYLLEARLLKTGDDDLWLRSRRVARMTPQGRRLVRIKVGAHWARPEEDDVVALTRMGIPVGPRVTGG